MGLKESKTPYFVLRLPMARPFTKKSAVVRSGKRVMSVLAAIKDEKMGGNFLASMTDAEFQAFQNRLASVLKGSARSPSK